MEILIDDRQSSLDIHASMVKKIVSEVVAYEGNHYDEVAIHFVSSQEISSLHAQFFDDPTPTDCISFPLNEPIDSPYRVMGDVFVCPEMAIKYAAAHRGDPYKETTLYIVHGLLHLMGYDDIKFEDRRAMRAAEKRHMRHLKAELLILKK